MKLCRHNFRASSLAAVSSLSSFATRGSDSATTGAAMATSAGPSGARTHGGGVAALITRLRTQHRAVSGAVSVVAVGVVALLLASPASADAPSHGFAFTYGDGEPTSATNVRDPYPVSFEVPEGVGHTRGDIAIDQRTGDLYVADPGNHRVEKFNSKGEFLLMFGKEVNKHGATEAEQGVCTAAPGEECQPGQPSIPSGSVFQHAFGAVSSIAVDESSGGYEDVYVYSTDDGVTGGAISKFDPSGHYVTSWGEEGRIGNTEPGFAGPLSQDFQSTGILAVGSTGNLYFSTVDQFVAFSQAGHEIHAPPLLESGKDGFENGVEDLLHIDAVGDFYETPGTSQVYEGSTAIYEFNPAGETLGQLTSKSLPTYGFAFDPALGDLYQNAEGEIEHYDPDCQPSELGCQPRDAFGAGHVFAGGAVQADLVVDGASGTVYLANPGTSDLAAFTPLTPAASTEPPTGLTETAATLHAEVGPETNEEDHGPITSCRFEYGLKPTYGLGTVPCLSDQLGHEEEEIGTPTNPIESLTDVHADLTGLPRLSNLPPNTEFHYRVLATNESGAVGIGRDEPFLTTRPPAIAGLSSREVTATSAHLSARVNPDGLQTACRFEYGTTTAYGHTAPCEPHEAIGSSQEDQSVEAHLKGLTEGVTYHYRLLAENELDAGHPVTSQDDTFAFLPPSCPNQVVREQTQSNYLPDCRAYELVSPPNAEGTQLFPGGPNTGYADDPSRFAYVGDFGTLREAGGSPLGNGDLYIATRTATGWTSHYVGLASGQAALDGGPPYGLIHYLPGTPPLAGVNNGATGPGQIQNEVFTDPGMADFLEFNDGNQGVGGFIESLENPTPIPSYAPYLFSAAGAFRERLPTNLGLISGARAALDCPTLEPVPGDVGDAYINTFNVCSSEATASPDLGHFVFSTQRAVFAPEGQLAAPGSVYDNEVASGTVLVASKLPSGSPIPAQPTDHAKEDILRVPALSADGSHILIAAGVTGGCGQATCPEPPCGSNPGSGAPCPLQPSQLYMRIDDATTIEIAPGHSVNYLGMTSDGSKVFFTSEEHLTAEDPDHGGASLFMWRSQKGRRKTARSP